MLYRFLPVFAIVLFIVACQNPTSQVEQARAHPIKYKLLTGYFADDAYSKRSEGYDWVGVITNLINDSMVHVAVRSRSDQKKPTCTFDADAKILNDSTIATIVNGVEIHFLLDSSSITIQTLNEADQSVLNYFCSGGVSLAGRYLRLFTPLDEKQVDKTLFVKNLSLQNIFFEVRSVGTDSIPVLSVITTGLKKINEPFTTVLQNAIVIDAEVEDLNADGSPELFIYTRSKDKDAKVEVIAFSVNNKHSMSMIAFPDLKDNQRASEGYNGHDEFRVVERRLVHRFPLAAKNKQGGTLYRYISYRLVEGESIRKLQIDSIKDQ